MNRQKVIIYSTLLLDIIGIAIIIPAFPELKAYYGINDFQVTLSFAIYSLCAFLSAPVLGQLSDKLWRKKPLVLCIIGTFFSYMLLLVTQQYRVFLVSRMLNGLTWGNISILQAVLTDISPDQKTRAKNFGLMGAIFGLGFIIGPIFGSLILRFGNVTSIFAFGAVFALLEIILVYLKFKNTNELHPHKHIVYNPFRVMRKYLKHPTISNLLVSLAFLGIGGFIINSSMSLYMNGLFGTTGEQYWYYLAFAGVLAALNMSVLVPKFWLKHFSLKKIIWIAHMVLMVGYLLVGLSNNLYMFLTLFYITIALGNSYAPVYNMEIMSKAKPTEIGEISGMLGGAQSLFMFFGPMIGGALLLYHVNIFLGAVVAIVASLVVMTRYFIRKGKVIVE